MTASSAIFTPDVKIADDAVAFSEMAASFFMAAIENISSPLIVLPTGNTPLGLYDVLATRHAHRRDVWDRMRFLQMDEYAGLNPGDGRLFSGWLSRVFLDRVAIPAPNRMFFRSDAPDPAVEVARIESWLSANGPVDLAVDGLGTNGHLAFNEPGTAFNQSAHFVTLTPETRQANAAYWGGVEHVPTHAYTLGLDVLAGARRVMLLACGEHKARILHRALYGPVGPEVPASALRTRADVTVFTDRAAAKFFPQMG